MITHDKEIVMRNLMQVFCFFLGFFFSILSANEFLYVVNSGENTVSVIDPLENEVIGVIPVGENPTRIAVSPDRRTLCVANKGDNTVSLIDNNLSTKAISVGNAPNMAVFTPNGKEVWVMNSRDSSLSIIDMRAKKVEKTIRLTDSNYMDLGIMPDGKLAYAVGNTGIMIPREGIISKINVEKKTLINDFNLHRGLKRIVIHPQGNLAYGLSSAGAAISFINVISTLIPKWETFRFGGVFQDLVISPDGDIAYITNSEDNTIYMMDLESRKVIPFVTVGNAPLSIALNTEGKFGYVANAEDDTISVINLEARRVVKTVHVGLYPTDVAYAEGPEFLKYIALTTRFLCKRLIEKNEELERRIKKLEDDN